jgi:hypothetical protein
MELLTGPPRRIPDPPPDHGKLTEVVPKPLLDFADTQSANHSLHLGLYTDRDEMMDRNSQCLRAGQPRLA